MTTQLGRQSPVTDLCTSEKGRVVVVVVECRVDRRQTQGRQALASRRGHPFTHYVHVGRWNPFLSYLLNDRG